MRLRSDIADFGKDIEGPQPETNDGEYDEEVA